MRCVAFLCHLLQETYPWANGVRMHHNVCIHTTNPQIMTQDVHNAFVHHGFMVQENASG